MKLLFRAIIIADYAKGPSFYCLEVTQPMLEIFQERIKNVKDFSNLEIDFTGASFWDQDGDWLNWEVTDLLKLHNINFNIYGYAVVPDEIDISKNIYEVYGPEMLVMFDGDMIFQARDDDLNVMFSTNFIDLETIMDEFISSQQ